MPLPLPKHHMKVVDADIRVHRFGCEAERQELMYFSAFTSLFLCSKAVLSGGINMPQIQAQAAISG